MTPGLRAVRTSVALSRLDHVALVALRGVDAIDVLDRLVPKNLYLRDGEVLQTVFCRPDGTVLADVLAIADEQDFLLLVEGISGDAAVAHITAQLRPGEDAASEDLTGQTSLLGVDGPYAWELLVAVIGPEVVGLPYLHAVAMGDGTVLVRAGKTGEFGYVFIAEPQAGERWVADLERQGASMELDWAGLDELDMAAIENFFYCPRQSGLAGLTLGELQLQWRVSPDKTDYVGAAALRAQLDVPVARRLTYGLAEGALEVGEVVRHEGRAVGRVLGTMRSGTTGAQLVWMLIERQVAHPHRDFQAGQHAIRTVGPPIVDNRSLYVDPQKHSWATRANHRFPALH